MPAEQPAGTAVIRGAVIAADNGNPVRQAQVWVSGEGGRARTATTDAQGRFRLDAENVRDAWLAASGLLTRQLGGPSVRPPLPADIAAIGYAGSIKWQDSEGPDRYRRGLYVFFQRTVPYPMLTTFDAPDSTTACARRERSNTPLQALTLLNDPVFFECAQALGRRMTSLGGDTTSKLRFAFEQCLGRAPSRDEKARLEQLYAAHSRLASPDESLVAETV